MGVSFHPRFNNFKGSSAAFSGGGRGGALTYNKKKQTSASSVEPRPLVGAFELWELIVNISIAKTHN